MYTQDRPLDLQAIIKSEYTDARTFVDSELGSERAKSLKYYRGESLGNEEDGRSRVVRRVVLDAVHSVLPSLMRVFFSSERAVEYVPQGPEDVAMAEQATDYINWVITEDNPGFQVFYSAFCDALYQKAGIVKWYSDESIEVSYHEFTGLTDQALALVLQEPNTEISKISSTPIEEAVPQALMMGVEPPSLHDAEIKRVQKEPRIRIAAVPPEEFLIDRNARSIDEARYVAHRSLVSMDKLIRMGYEPEFLRRHLSNADIFEDAEDVFQRYAKLGGAFPEDTKNEAERKVLYVESYIRADSDGDGIAELRKVCTVGEAFEVVNDEPCSERPFAGFVVNPEPHLFYGMDLADQTRDLQEIETAILRNLLDSLAQSIFPRTAVVEGQVNLDDVLNTEMGAVIRMNAPGMVQPFATPFVGAPGLSVLELMKGEREARVGTHNMALDAEALQSTTRSAVEAQVSAAKARLELIARIFAETGMKRVFKGLLRLTVAHADRKKMVRLRNQFVEVDPSAWNASMDVAVNVGLGHGLEQDRVMALRETLQIQREVLQTMGPSNPLVGLGHVRNTLGKLLEHAGYKDSSQFFKQIPLDYEPPPPPPPPPDPAQMLAQVEMQKIQSDMVQAQAKLELDQDKAFADILLRAEEIEKKYGTQVDIARLKATIEQNRFAAAKN